MCAAIRQTAATPPGEAHSTHAKTILMNRAQLARAAVGDVRGESDGSEQPPARHLVAAAAQRERAGLQCVD